MSKNPASSAESRSGPARSLSKQGIATKGSINLRLTVETRRMIDEAAALVGKTRTEFMVESARRQAIDTVLSQRLFVLAEPSFEMFAAALDGVTAPGPKLRTLLRRAPAWRA